MPDAHLEYPVLIQRCYAAFTAATAPIFPENPDDCAFPSTTSSGKCWTKLLARAKKFTGRSGMVASNMGGGRVGAGRVGGCVGQLLEISWENATTVRVKIADRSLCQDSGVAAVANGFRAWLRP